MSGSSGITPIMPKGVYFCVCMRLCLHIPVHILCVSLCVLYVYLSMCGYTQKNCTFAFVCVHVYTGMCLCVCVHEHMCLCLHLCTCAHVCLYACVSVHVRVYAHVCVVVEAEVVMWEDGLRI